MPSRKQEGARIPMPPPRQPTEREYRAFSQGQQAIIDTSDSDVMIEFLDAGGNLQQVAAPHIVMVVSDGQPVARSSVVVTGGREIHVSYVTGQKVAQQVESYWRDWRRAQSVPVMIVSGVDK